jgi:hypothetical protein
MCHALPQTDLVAQVWWRSLGGLLMVQVLQAVTLHMAVATLLTGGANLPMLGLPADPSGVLNLLITCYLLWLVIRVPRWVARTLGDNGRSRGLLGYVVRVVVVQQLLGAAGLRGGRLLAGGGRRAAAAGGGGGAASGGAAATHLHSHANSHLHPGRPWPGQGPAPSGSPGPGAPRAHGGPFSTPALAASSAGAGSSGTGWPPNPPSRRPASGQRSGTGWPTTATPARPAAPGSGPADPNRSRPGRPGSGVGRG